MGIEEDLVFIDLEASTKEEALQLMGTRLAAGGFVKEGFIDSVMEREKNYPTGLPTEPFGVAIPHADGDMVHESRIAFASLKKPVQFLMMGTDDKLVDVKLIFMLALNNPEDQLETLQKLIELIQNPDMVVKLAHTKSVDELNELIEGRL